MNISLPCRKDRTANFAANLRRLCGSLGSISEACRRLAISRQQFTKYLSGTHLPSPRNLERINSFFGIGETEIFLEPSRFAEMTSSVDFDFLRVLRHSPSFAQFSMQQNGAAKHLAEYYGVYERYHFSSIYHGRILRSILCIYPRDGIPHHCYIERFPSYDDPRRSDYLFKYHGICSHIGGRLIFLDFEVLQNNELTFSAIIPSHRNTVRFLYGVTTGVAATLHREPFATRVALHFRDRGLISRRHLERARTLHPEDASIPFEIKEYLGSKPNIVRGG